MHTRVHGTIVEVFAALRCVCIVDAMDHLKEQLRIRRRLIMLQETHAVAAAKEETTKAAQMVMDEVESKKSWVCLGDTFVLMQHSAVQQFVDKGACMRVRRVVRSATDTATAAAEARRLEAETTAISNEFEALADRADT